MSENTSGNPSVGGDGESLVGTRWKYKDGSVWAVAKERDSVSIELRRETDGESSGYYVRETMFRASLWTRLPASPKVERPEPGVGRLPPREGDTWATKDAYPGEFTFTGKLYPGGTKVNGPWEFITKNGKRDGYDRAAIEANIRSGNLTFLRHAAAPSPTEPGTGVAPKAEKVVRQASVDGVNWVAVSDGDALESYRLLRKSTGNGWRVINLDMERLAAAPSKPIVTKPEPKWTVAVRAKALPPHESGPGITLTCCKPFACKLHRTMGPSYVNGDGWELLPEWNERRGTR